MKPEPGQLATLKRAIPAGSVVSVEGVLPGIGIVEVSWVDTETGLHVVAPAYARDIEEVKESGWQRGDLCESVRHPGLLMVIDEVFPLESMADCRYPGCHGPVCVPLDELIRKPGFALIGKSTETRNHDGSGTVTIELGAGVDVEREAERKKGAS